MILEMPRLDDTGARVCCRDVRAAKRITKLISGWDWPVLRTRWAQDRWRTKKPLELLDLCGKVDAER